MLIRSNRIYTPQGCKAGILHIEDGKILDILNPHVRIAIDMDLGDLRVLPGIIDTHNHGTMGYGLFGEKNNNEDNVRHYLKGLASQGVTACLPTPSVEVLEAVVKVCKSEVDGAKPIGIHIEGPYLNRVGEKGINEGHLDIHMEDVKEIVKKSHGLLKMMGIAPEIPGAKEVIEYLSSHGIRSAFAHSNMMYQEALEAFKWGISVTTHTANVMSGIHHRNMGGLGACLLNDDVYNELICDGLHVSNEMIELMFRVKKDAFDKFMMVSDNVQVSGAPVGRYQLEGRHTLNIDEKGFCLSDTGRLMGSTVPVIKGIKNLAENMHIDLVDIIKMASENPAKVYGAKSKGKLEKGMDADFIIIDDDYNVLKSYSEGRCIYDYEKDKDLFNPQFLKECQVHE